MFSHWNVESLTVSSIWMAITDPHVVILSWKGVWRIDSSRGSGTGRRRPMEKEQEQVSVAFSASVTIPSTTSASTSTSAGTISYSSSRQQAVPQISVYGGITDRQTVQVEVNLSQSNVSALLLPHKLALSSGAIYRPHAASTSFIYQQLYVFSSTKVISLIWYCLLLDRFKFCFKFLFIFS